MTNLRKKEYTHIDQLSLHAGQARTSVRGLADLQNPGQIDTDSGKSSSINSRSFDPSRTHKLLLQSSKPSGFTFSSSYIYGVLFGCRITESQSVPLQLIPIFKTQTSQNILNI
jgi:hypothetical protein